MSAKSRNFAPQFNINMEIKDMRHTAWRCRHSQYVTRWDGLRCLKLCKGASDEVCAKCEEWKASDVAESYFNGTLRGDLKNIVSSIMLERKRTGRF